METLLDSESLMDRVRSVTSSALASGALEPVGTDQVYREIGGFTYLFHVLRGRDKKFENLVTQKKEQARVGDKANPFLPYDPRMEVALIGTTHACLLNKFPVIDRHLLLVTRHYEHQDRVLNLNDFQACWAVLSRLDGLVFYNGGTAAGASQRHKHLQVVPLPMSEKLHLPIEPFLADAKAKDRLGRIPAFNFAHAWAPLTEDVWHDPEGSARILSLYRGMLRSLALGDGLGDPGAYNLLLTRSWMLVVPRAREYFQGVGLNSLGFSGSIFVRNQAQMEQVTAMGPLQLMRGVSYPL